MAVVLHCEGISNSEVQTLVVWPTHWLGLILTAGFNNFFRSTFCFLFFLPSSSASCGRLCLPLPFQPHPWSVWVSFPLSYERATSIFISQIWWFQPFYISLFSKKKKKKRTALWSWFFKFTGDPKLIFFLVSQGPLIRKKEKKSFPAADEIVLSRPSSRGFSATQGNQRRRPFCAVRSN